jgi:radical SAM superfamily enzyme YgiQ (UPF0313 family)
VVLFPGSYHLGMSTLATHTLYRLLNDGDLACERAFADGSQPFLPLRSLETGARLRDFDFIAIPSSYELDWPLIPAALAGSGIPARRDDRRGDDPLVLMGGPALTAAPLPMQPIYDAAFIGEVEPAIGELRQALLQPNREARLEGLAAIAGFYVPELHDAPGPRSLRRQCARDLNAFATCSVILTPHTEFASRFLVEVGRGCGRGCSFCLARQAYQPLRWRSVDHLLDTIRPGLEHTRDVGLIAAAVSDYPDLSGLCTGLEELSPDLRVTTTSVRMESATPEFLALLARGGQRTVTFAPEAATEDLRRHIGKTLADADLLAAVERALSTGLSRIRLYFMVGLPGETPEDRQAIISLGQRLSASFPRTRFQFNVGAFSPRPHTPFEHAPVTDPGVLQDWITVIARGLQGVKRVEVSPGSGRQAALQAISSRAGALLGMALGDLAHDQVADPGYGVVLRALRARGLSPEDLLGPQEPTDDQPWKVVEMRCAD